MSESWRRHLPPRSVRRGWLYERLLTVVLVGLFLAWWVGQFVAQVAEAGNNAEEHRQRVCQVMP